MASNGLAHWQARETSGLLDESIGEVLARRATDDGDQVALWVPVGGSVHQIKYAELYERACAVAALLRELSPGQRVAVWGNNSPEWVLLEYGCALRGLVLVPFNTAWTDLEAGAAAEQVEPSIVFTGLDRQGQATFGPRAAALFGAERVRELADLTERAAAAPPEVDVEPAHPFLIQFTSGTTGRAKGAVLSHRAALNAAYLRIRQDMNAETRLCLNNAVPFHHVGGSISIILGALTTGGSFIVLDRFRPDESVRLLSECTVTHLGGVPIMMEQLLDRLAAMPGAADSLRAVALGGAAVSPALVHRVQHQTGARVLITYAQSECPMITNSGRDDPPELVATTVGFGSDATELRVTDTETGRTLRYGEHGEIQVRSPMTMTEYYGMPEQTAEAFTSDGFLRTGDIGSMDPDGHLRIHDRVRDVIIRGGENIYPAEVEAVLGEHPDVVGCAVVGVPDPRWGEQVAATIVVSAQPADTAAIEEFLVARLAHFKIPHLWRVVDELPITASGKVRRNLVRDAMSADASQPAPED